MKRRLGSLLWLLFLGSTAGLDLLQAQENRGTILGRVTDPSGAVIAGAAIEATNLDTGVATDTASNEAGNYVLPAMPPGRYRVSAASSGFRKAEAPELILQIQQQARLDFAMVVGDVAETVSVTAETAVLKTEDATLGQLVDNKKLVELPVSGRNVAALTLLGTGATTTTNGISGIIAGLLTGGVAMTANGVRDTANQYSVDGANVNVGLYNAPTFMPVLDSVEEFKVRTGNYSAEFGGYGGAHIDYSLRSGTNEFHGNLWEFLRNDALDARNAFATTKPVLRQNQFGALGSGPIRTNKTFFMTSFEGLRRKSQTLRQAIVPTAAQRAGDLTFMTDGRREPAITDPLSGQPFPNNQIPTSRFAATTRKALEYFPLPNQAGGVNYREQPGLPRDEESVLVKIDHNFTERTRLSGRYMYQHTNTGQVKSPIGSQFNTSSFGTKAQNVALMATHTFTPATFLDARVSWNRLYVTELSQRNGSAFDARSELGMLIPSSIAPNAKENNFPVFTIEGYSTIGDWVDLPLYQPDENYQIVPSLFMLRGRHSLKAGMDFRRLRSSRFQGNNTNGRINFQAGNAGGSGHALADFLLGLPRSTSISLLPIVVDLRETYYHFFLADTWAIAPSLTLSLGVRYELNVPVYETYGRIPQFSFVPPGSFEVLKGGQGLYNWDRNNFAPRLALAWRPIAKTVVRTGYGIFYSEPPQLNLTARASNPPFITAQSFFASKETPLQASNPFPIGLAAAGGVPAPNAYQSDRRTPYVQTWSLDIQRSLTPDTVFEVGYVGNHAVKMGRTVSWNVPLPGPGAIQGRRPLPVIGPVSYYGFDSFSNYNALQMRLEKRFSKGFSVLGSYTFGRSLDVSGNELTGGTVDPRNQNRDRGPSEYYLKHRLSVAYVLELPFGPGKPWLSSGGPLGHVLGGWQLSGVTAMQSGRPLTVAVPGDLANIGLGTRPDRVCNGSLSDRSVDKWFDTACFVPPAQYTIGNSGRGILEGPGSQGWDVGIMKRFRLFERHWIQFRGEMFNFVNKVNLGNPGTTTGQATYGRILSSGSARSVQFGLKYGF